jgi:serine/threonine protein kinase
MPPARVGRFEVLTELSRGGAGVVYEARDPTTDRKVAVKVLLNRSLTPTGLARFRREAEALARIQHPHVVSIHEFGESDRGQLFLVLELVEGESLQDSLTRDGSLDPATAVAVVRDLADALETCHARGVLHRDLKPSNVLIDRAGQVKLTDFGLCSLFDDSPVESRLTQEGHFHGTPGYWAPEQALGRLDDIGPGTDVYGLGALLFAALTGEPPNEATTLPQHVAMASRSPRSPRELRPELPAALARVCTRALALEPARRHASAAALADALERALTPAARARGAWRVALLLALAALAGISFSRPRARPAAAPSATTPASHRPSPSAPEPPPPLPQLEAPLKHNLSGVHGAWFLDAGWLVTLHAPRQGDPRGQFWRFTATDLEPGETFSLGSLSLVPARGGVLYRERRSGRLVHRRPEAQPEPLWSLPALPPQVLAAPTDLRWVAGADRPRLLAWRSGEATPFLDHALDALCDPERGTLYLAAAGDGRDLALALERKDRSEAGWLLLWVRLVAPAGDAQAGGGRRRRAPAAGRLRPGADRPHPSRPQGPRGDPGRSRLAHGRGERAGVAPRRAALEHPNQPHPDLLGPRLGPRRRHPASRRPAAGAQLLHLRGHPPAAQRGRGHPAAPRARDRAPGHAAAGAARPLPGRHAQRRAHRRLVSPSGTDYGARMPAPHAWQPGARIDDYVLGEKLGEGGMGVVFAATHVSTGAPRALKAISGQADPELLLRFQREGQAQAAVDAHPNVVRVHAAGQAAGRHYLVLDLATGGDLKRRLDQGPLPPDDAAALVAALARGLEHVHRHGVLHRDLKPHNVLFDAHGPPQLVDVGLPRLVDGSSLAQTGQILGTPSYMAPEQAAGEPVDARTDVYGLGAVLFTCLTGRPPFRGGSHLAVLHQVLHKPPPSPRSLRPEIPQHLEAVCLTALSKSPDERYPSARAMEEALAPRPLAKRGGLGATPAALVCLAALALAGVGARLALPGARSTSPPPAPSGPRSTAADVALSPSPADPAPTLRAPFSKVLPGAKLARFLGDGWLVAQQEYPDPGARLWRLDVAAASLKPGPEFPSADSRSLVLTDAGVLYRSQADALVWLVDPGREPRRPWTLAPGDTNWLAAPRDRRWVAASFRLITRIWRRDETEPFHTATLERGLVTASSSADGRYLLLALEGPAAGELDQSEDYGLLLCWDTRASPPTERRISLPSNPTALLPLGSGSELLVGCQDGQIRRVDCETGQTLATHAPDVAPSEVFSEARTRKAAIQDMALLPNGHLLAVTASSRQLPCSLLHWTLDTGQALREHIRTRTSSFRAVDVDPELGAVLLSVKDQGLLLIPLDRLLEGTLDPLAPRGW